MYLESEEVIRQLHPRSSHISYCLMQAVWQELETWQQARATASSRRDGPWHHYGTTYFW